MPAPALQIRVFETGDTDEVIRLWETCGLTRPWNDPLSDIMRKLDYQPEFFLVGLINGNIVASVMGGYEGHRGWVYYLSVAPEHRRKGYGKRIMEEVESRLLSAGCPKINLMVRNDNNAVVGFYNKIGYTTEETIELGKRLIPDVPSYKNKI